MRWASGIALLIEKMAPGAKAKKKGGSPGMQAAAKDIISATKAGDADALAGALCNAFDIHQSSEAE